MKLRWHAQVRTLNGGITCGLRIRAANAHEAVDRAQMKAYRDHGFIEAHGRRYKLEEWYVIYVGLHVPDHNSIDKV